MCRERPPADGELSSGAVSFLKRNCARNWNGLLQTRQWEKPPPAHASITASTLARQTGQSFEAPLPLLRREGG
jgi:hypothetical protein